MEKKRSGQMTVSCQNQARNENKNEKYFPPDVTFISEYGFKIINIYVFQELLFIKSYFY